MNLPRFSPLKKTIFAILVLLLGSPCLTHAGCGGIARWSIKVGSDTDVAKIASTVVPISIADWNKLKRPEQSFGNTTPRYTTPQTGEGSEVAVYQIDGYLTEFIKQQDQDYHLLLSDGHGHSMVAEVVDPKCIPGANDNPNPSAFDTQLKNARAAFEKIVADENYKLDTPVHVKVTGVGFFDRPHGKGQSPNTMELHPVLDIVKVP